MDPLTDLDRAIRDALDVEPGAHFAARVRARVAETSVESRTPLGGLAYAAIACAIAAVIVAGGWWQTNPVLEDHSVLPSRDLAVLSPPAVVRPSKPHHQSRAPMRIVADVVISRSEMLALQRLFSGLTVAPPPLDPPADTLAIPELVIEPIAPFPANEGVRQ